MSPQHTLAEMETSLRYKDQGSRECISAMSRLFSGLRKGETVRATITPSTTRGNHEAITEIHNNLLTCTTWSDVRGWDEEVEYTINNPSGDVYAHDTKSTGTLLRTRKCTGAEFRATCESTDACATIARVSEEPVVNIDFSTTRFSWVKVTNVKRFFYESPRTSLVYKLVVQWEGQTKEAARENGMQFKVYLESNDHTKMGADPGYSIASFMEKTIDLLSDKQRQVLRVEQAPA